MPIISNPIEFQYLDNGLGFGFTATENFLGKELIEAATNAYQSEEILRKNKYGIIDYSPVEKFDVATSDIEAVAELCMEAAKISQVNKGRTKLMQKIGNA